MRGGEEPRERQVWNHMERWHWQLLKRKPSRCGCLLPADDPPWQRQPRCLSRPSPSSAPCLRLLVCDREVGTLPLHGPAMLGNPRAPTVTFELWPDARRLPFAGKRKSLSFEAGFQKSAYTLGYM